MTYAPANLTQLMTYLATKGVVNLGIVGSATHTYGYHLGKDRIFSAGGQGLNDYSVKATRDKNGLSNAAMAVDLGRVGGSLVGLRNITAWLWKECQAEKPDTRMIREVLGSADGTTVRCWVARESGGPVLLSNCADASHLTHTHISFYRDAENVDVRPLFARYFGVGGAIELPPFIPTAQFSHVKNRTSSLKAATPMREQPAAGATVLRTYNAGTGFFPVCQAATPAGAWYGCWLYDDSPAGYTFGYFPVAACTPLTVTENPPDVDAPVDCAALIEQATAPLEDEVTRLKALIGDHNDVETRMQGIKP